MDVEEEFIPLRNRDRRILRDLSEDTPSTVVPRDSGNGLVSRIIEERLKLLRTEIAKINSILDEIKSNVKKRKKGREATNEPPVKIGMYMGRGQTRHLYARSINERQNPSANNQRHRRIFCEESIYIFFSPTNNC